MLDFVLQGLRAAAEPTRLRLLALCADSELTVTELTEILGQSQPRVSQHLRQLCDAGLLERRQEGTWAFYRLISDGAGRGLVQTLLSLLPEKDEALTLDLERLSKVKQARAVEAQRLFAENAPRWDELRKLYVPEREVESALKGVFSNMHVGDFLDIGTGTGRILDLMTDQIDRGIGIDLSRAMLAVARVNLQRSGASKCQVRHGDMYKMPFARESFDAVSIHMVLHYSDDPSTVLVEAGRVLRPGGCMAVVDFDRHDLEFLRTEHGHRRLGFTDTEIRDWFRGAGLECETVRRLEGEELTVVLWGARRLIDASDAAGSPLS